MVIPAINGDYTLSSHIGSLDIFQFPPANRSRTACAFRSVLWYRSYITRKYSHFASFPKPSALLEIFVVGAGLHPTCLDGLPFGLHFAWRDSYVCNTTEVRCKLTEYPAGYCGMGVTSKRITWLCVLLTLWSAYSFAAHRHSTSGDEAQCTVCVVAHSASPVAAATLPNTVLVLARHALAGEPISAQQRLIAFALSVRPPPAV